MPAEYVLAPHDDGRWYPARLLDQRRQPDGTWRCTVRYTVEPGLTFERAYPATELRREDGTAP